MTKAITKEELAGSTAIPSGAAAGALLTEADAAAQAKATFEAALVAFETYGRQAAVGQGVATEMAFDFARMCRDGAAKQDDGDALYAAYATGFNRAKREDMDELAADSYASALSIFKTFGLEYAVAVGALKFYGEVAAFRKSVTDKATVIGSNYSCYVAFNRRLSDGVKKEGATAVMTMLASDEARAEFIRSTVLKPSASAKDEFAKALVLADGIARLGKGSAHALKDDWAELAKVVADRAVFLKARSERRAIENAALLIKKVA
jgi:hypothetical protein